MRAATKFAKQYFGATVFLNSFYNENCNSERDMNINFNDHYYPEHPLQWELKKGKG